MGPCRTTNWLYHVHVATSCSTTGRAVLPLSFGFRQFRGYSNDGGTRNRWMAAKIRHSILAMRVLAITAVAFGMKSAEVAGELVINATPAEPARPSTFSPGSKGKKRLHHHAHDRQSDRTYHGITTGFIGRDPDHVRMFSGLHLAARPRTRHGVAYRASDAACVFIGSVLLTF